jgi:hypothetical protein
MTQAYFGDYLPFEEDLALDLSNFTAILPISDGENLKILK